MVIPESLVPGYYITLYPGYILPNWACCCYTIPIPNSDFFAVNIFKPFFKVFLPWCRIGIFTLRELIFQVVSIVWPLVYRGEHISFLAKHYLYIWLHLHFPLWRLIGWEI